MSATKLSTTRVGKSYRTTIPREVRKILGLGIGDEIEWLFENGRVYIARRGG